MFSAKIREKSIAKMRPIRLLVVLLFTMVALILGGVVSEVWAKRGFEDADVYAELNDTDEDLGFHALIDGEDWRVLEIEDPNEREILDIKANSILRRQGLTELFFESAEPSFDELSPEEFFNRFPAGMYEIEGETLDGKELESKDLFRHVMPAAPDNIRVNGGDPILHKEVDCPNGGPEVELADAEDTVVITWDPVETSHPNVGDDGDIEVELYQVAVEQDDLEFSANLPSDITELVLPPGLLQPGNVKFEIVVKEAEGGNQTGAESCFTIIQP